MDIRKSTLADLPVLMDIYAYARRFMISTGNTNQWINGYPSEEIIRADIASGHSYICLNDDVPVGAFCFFIAPDPTYAYIEAGSWLNDAPYGVVHRLAGNGRLKGLGDRCLQWCFDQCGNLRVDTHHDNAVMQRIFLRNGFKRCGIIYLASGAPRIAFHKLASNV